MLLPAVALALGAAIQAATQAGAQPTALVAYEVVEGAIPRPLTATPGDAARGARLALDRSLGNCVTCHEVPLRADFQGNLGPDLAGVGGRYEPGELRLRLVDSKRVNPESNMPSYYRLEGLNNVRRDWAGKPILEPQQVEDILAWLLTLR
jgi:sulfur-oxidizing protein SoxX